MKLWGKQQQSAEQPSDAPSGVAADAPATATSKSIKPRKSFLLITALVLAVGGAVTVGVLQYRHVSNHNKYVAKHGTKQVCSDDTLKKAAANFAPENSQKLKPIATDIMKLKDFDKDPNCLYVVTNYYINVTDYVNAKKYFAELQNRYDRNKGVSAILGGSVNIYAMSQRMDGLQKQNEEVQHNSYIVPAGLK